MPGRHSEPALPGVAETEDTVKTIELRNDFHNTHTRIRVRPDGTVSARVVSRARRTLCGCNGCTCSGADGSRPGSRIVGPTPSGDFLVL
jgi:hypothetical protein